MLGPTQEQQDHIRRLRTSNSLRSIVAVVGGAAVDIRLRGILYFRRHRAMTTAIHGVLALRTSSVRDMEGLVLRVRLISGDSMDVTYDDRSAGSESEVIDEVVSTLSQDSGVLRCRHGGRLLVLYARGVAAVEVAPRGAVL